MAADITTPVGYRTVLWAWFFGAGHADGSYGIDSEITAHIRTCGIDPLASGLPDFEEVGVFDEMDSGRTATAVLASVTCRCGMYGRGAKSATWICTSPDLSDLVQGVVRAATEAPPPE